MPNVYEIERAVQHFDGTGCEFVVVVRDSADPGISGHAETVYCKEDHNHSKACAAALMKAKAVSGKDGKGKDILGKSPMDVCEEFMAKARAHQKPVDLEMPTKKVDVPDKGLSL